MARDRDLIIGLAGIDDLIAGLEGPAFEKKLAGVLRMTVNGTATYAHSTARDQMLAEVNFPAGYLRGSSSRLKVSQKASDDNLEAIITGRADATSLARFVTSSSRKGGVNVQTLKGGGPKNIKGGFLIPLRKGSTDLGNRGLAVRTDGSKPRGSYKPKLIGDGLWLLYGPSVDQVFNAVKDDIRDRVQDKMQNEFNRLWDWKFST